MTFGFYLFGGIYGQGHCALFLFAFYNYSQEYRFTFAPVHCVALFSVGQVNAWW